MSPRLMLSSELDKGILGRETPIKSADSLRVDTEERRRWWELRFAPPNELRVGEWGGESFVEVETGVGRDMGTETELLREWEREWRRGAGWLVPAGGTGLPNENEFICERRDVSLGRRQRRRGDWQEDRL